MKTVKFEIAAAFLPFIMEQKRYKVAYGGRGGGKSQNIIRLLLALALEKPRRILNTRAVRYALRDSIYQLYTDLIHAWQLERYFTFRNDFIEVFNGSRLLFCGLNGGQSHQIKSMEGIDICFVEEAEYVEEEAWLTLLPSIRKESSEIWISFNPQSTDSPVWRRFIEEERSAILRIYVCYKDNPWFPLSLRHEIAHDKKHWPERYQTIWLGKPQKNSEELVFGQHFHRETVSEPPPETPLFYGIDWGFADDPTALIACYIVDNKLYIYKEVILYRAAVADLPAQLLAVIPPYATAYADASRPELIAYCRQAGLRIKAAPKGAGSINKGLYYIKSLRTVLIDSECPQTFYEFSNYRYKRDKMTGHLIMTPEDKYNHTIDAIRYALTACIYQQTSLLDVIN
jgi:phage terminase large subunit